METRDAIAGLNPSYLRSRGLVVLERDRDSVTVGSWRDLDVGERRALEFATGAQLRLVRLSKDEVAARAAPDAVDQPVPALHSAAGMPHAPSLASLLQEKFRVGGSPEAMLAHLLEAGYSPQDAWTSFDVDGSHTSRLPGFSTAMARGDSFADAIEGEGALPLWLRNIVAASHEEDAQIGSFIAVARFDETMARMSTTVRRSRIEAAMLWLAAVVAAFTVSAVFGLIAATTGTAMTLWYGRLCARHPQSDLMRAEILRMVDVAARRDIPPTLAIRASLARLDAVLPTWGTLPDTREGLAKALSLPPLSHAVLMKGDLSEGAGRAAAVHAQIGETTLAKCHWWNTRAAFFLLAAGIIGLLAG